MNSSVTDKLVQSLKHSERLNKIAIAVFKRIAFLVRQDKVFELQEIFLNS